MSTTGIIIGILVAAVLLVFAEMYRELHTFCVTRYQVASPKLAGPDFLRVNASYSGYE